MADSKIRAATDRDFDQLMGLYRQLNPEDTPNVDETAARVFGAIRRTDGLYLFVLEDATGRLRATCYLNITPNLTRRAQPYGVIENVVTDEAARGLGLGKQIMDHAVRLAWDQGCYKVMLMTGTSRGSTDLFYKACGFADDRKRAFEIRRPDGI